MAKWELTPDRLQELTTIQDKVLEQAAAQLKVNGTLAYATCSVFEVENRERIQAFLARRSSFKTIEDLQLYPRALGDGFFLSVLHKVA